jgi:predicted ferric reductase
MTADHKPRVPVFSSRTRLILAILCGLAAALLLLGAAAIPFEYESPSIKYKLGFDKTLLRAGKVLGIAAGLLLMLQLALSARLRILDRICGLNRLLVLHRLNAVAIALLALLHPLLVFAPEDIGIIPVSLEYWPEIMGGFLLILIWLITASGVWRLFLELSFDRWWLLHRVATATAVVALVVHVLFVSETFESGWPRLILLGTVGIYVLLFVRVKMMKPILMRKKRYAVSHVAPTGRDAYTIELRPEKHAVFDYIPGQFAFLTLESESISSEEHPFTISSTPTRPGTLQFTMRCRGDWTRRIGRLRPGDKALVDGPYGLFSHLARTETREIIMIAGGIGITPMLSMVRYMADVGDQRRIRLLWSNRTKAEIVFSEEVAELESLVEGLHVTHVWTREPGRDGKKGRLDREKLEKLLSGAEADSVVFVCGPPPMMREVSRSLREIGFPARTVHTEEFQL